MIKNTDEKIIRENPRGGIGKIELHQILTPEQMLGNVSLFAKVVLKSHTVIGVHRHIGEAEAYYVIKGEGFFTDDDGTRTAIKPGDICAIEVGQQHGIENPGDGEMEIIALVYPGTREE